VWVVALGVGKDACETVFCLLVRWPITSVVVYRASSYGGPFPLRFTRVVETVTVIGVLRTSQKVMKLAAHANVLLLLLFVALGRRLFQRAERVMCREGRDYTAGFFCEGWWAYLRLMVRIGKGKLKIGCQLSLRLNLRNRGGGALCC